MFSVQPKGHGGEQTERETLIYIFRDGANTAEVRRGLLAKFNGLGRQYIL